MTSLTDVYEGNVGRVASRRQQLLGTGLFVVGAAMVVGAIALATTTVGVQWLGRYPARELAGVLAGLGLPAVLLGVFAVLPAPRSTRAAALIGASIATIGVVLFQYAYPYEWVVGAPLLALATTAVYFLGVVTVFWCLFLALATFKTRNDPGGTARMAITREGTIRLVEEARSLGRFGGVGLFGTEPEGSVETQTNRETSPTSHDSATVEATNAPLGDGGQSSQSPSGRRSSPGESHSGGPTGQSRGRASQQPSSDGGTSTVGGASFNDDVRRSTRDGGDVDQYCGNCRHFEYVMDDGEPEPYCGLHDELMDDMDACSSWLKR
ncbi:hypothetical protein BRC91_08885 [Halobacteriales archaeon QS_4_62_28]|nr:MAG: hypothetical protein BRC91_08885 [Halobacteriales archaeon QS_4_62_28]